MEVRNRRRIKHFFFIISPSQILLRFNKVYSKLLTSEKFDVMTEKFDLVTESLRASVVTSGGGSGQPQKMAHLWNTGLVPAYMPDVGQCCCLTGSQEKKARRTLFLTIVHAFSLLKAREQLPVLRLSEM